MLASESSLLSVLVDLRLVDWDMCAELCLRVESIEIERRQGRVSANLGSDVNVSGF